MYRIIRFTGYARAIAIATALLSVLLYAITEHLIPGYPIFKVVTLSSAVSGGVLFLLGTSAVSRTIWGVVTRFDRSAFPDLNGTWSGRVFLESGEESVVRAVIRQALEYTHIDMHGATMKSITLEATPTIEQGQKRLYYVYECRPKNPEYSTYTGSTIFDIRCLREQGRTVLELTGRYFTDRKTVGRISLRHDSVDVNRDVSFY